MYPVINNKLSTAFLLTAYKEKRKMASIPDPAFINNSDINN